MQKFPDAERYERRNDFDPVDLRALNVGREGDVEFAVRDIHIYGFNAGALCAAGFGIDIKILDFVPADIQRKNALSRAADVFISFGKMKLHDVFAVGKFLGK